MNHFSSLPPKFRGILCRRNVLFISRQRATFAIMSMGSCVGNSTHGITVLTQETMECLENRTQRLIYLITYSRADTSKFPSRDSFAAAVLEACQSFSISVLHWVVCLEAHITSNSDSAREMNEYHFHMAVKLGKRARWLRVRNYLDDNFGIKVNFSDRHNSYYSAYRYVTKEDTEAVHSPGHPDLSDNSVPPRTESAITSRKRKAKRRSSGQNKTQGKRQRLSVYHVCEIVQAKNISSRL